MSIPTLARSMFLALGMLPWCAAASARPGDDPLPLPGVALAPTGGDGSGFGQSVAMEGDTAVVCGDFEAYAFRWDGAAWVQEDILSPPGVGEPLGPCALAGDTVLIGAPRQDGVGLDSGSVFVFVRDGSGVWSLEDELVAADAASEERFGAAVAIDGDRALIGASRSGTLVDPVGSAYVFERTGTVWAQATKIVPDEPTAEHFGLFVALSGDTALIGQSNPLLNIYVETAGVWGRHANIASANRGAIEGDRAVVPSPWTNTARIFERSGSTWAETGVIPGEVLTGALSGDRIVLTPTCFSSVGPRVYEEHDGEWILRTELELSSNPSHGWLRPVAMSGNRIVVGSKTFGEGCGSGYATRFELGDPVMPSSTFRNGGTNPASYTATAASIGETLELTVDLTTTGHSMALVFGYDSPFLLTLSGGQTLLCLDLLGSGGELVNTGFFPGPTASTSLAVPNSPDLVGFLVCTQALHAFGVAPFALSNAQDIVIGGCR